MQKCLINILSGFSLVFFNSSAFAGSLTGATIGGTAPNDYLVFGVSGTQTLPIAKTSANIASVLDGAAATPTGNVELAASSEQTNFDFSKNTTLMGTIGGKSLILSSLTATDWFGATLNNAYGANNLANKWFNDFITKAGYGLFVGTSQAANMYNNFRADGGFLATSDPNISYVNQDDTTGVINIGLAGYINLKVAYANNPKFASFATLLPNGFQASEVVKYTYNGETNFLYGFQATNSGLNDGFGGHTGNFEVTINGIPPTATSIPEPSSIAGLMTLGLLGTTLIKRKKV
ncbi:NF038130 family PEP-CTERM protein [Gloeothece verrucosa]|uniref:Ice-binding protein C-terminal domain-containing protein n=1 Tax=Gloeothece verrucosa (strain PCC 7822) TaxID=497965 RepID=E0UM68_GLOV7|nr:NF038130 family PEP-CTERM protein [Gloeothece verrucosa]ADN18048.1 protein of unknown function DUF1555 [Gloeothece verrucosa PCC 7822]